MSDFSIEMALRDGAITGGSIALNTGYVIKGFLSKGSFSRNGLKIEHGGETLVVDLSDEGEIEFMYKLTELAGEVELAWLELDDRHPDSCNGVWCYEVVEPFGEWLAECMMTAARLPEPDEARAKAIELAYDGCFDRPSPEA